MITESWNNAAWEYIDKQREQDLLIVGGIMTHRKYYQANEVLNVLYRYLKSGLRNTSEIRRIHKHGKIHVIQTGEGELSNILANSRIP